MMRFPSEAASKLNAKGASHFLRLGVIDSWMYVSKTIIPYGKPEIDS
jgi:hypothetical protein